MKGNKRLISAILGIAMLVTLLTGWGTTGVFAKEAVYNFSELTESSYSTKNSTVKVFDGDISITANEASTPTTVNYTATSPDGGTMSFTSGLRAKKMLMTVTLEAGEKLTVFYKGTDSGGTGNKSLNMSVIDSATGSVLMTEDNTEKEGKPYVLSYISENGGTYQIGDTSSGNRTLVFAVVITKDQAYDPTVGTGNSSGGSTDNSGGTATEAPTVTAEPKVTVDPSTVSEIEIISAKGWLETAYVKWTNTAAVDKYNVYYKRENALEYTKIDDALVRCYGSYYRADAVGLSSGKYTLKVAAVIAGAETDVKETEVITVQAHDREGYAFDPRSTYYNAEGLGAYKNDGTLKDNAQVLYIDNTNKDTVKHTVKVDGKATEGTGLVEILSLREKNNSETTPLVIRLIGQVKAPTGINNSGYVQIKKTSNITFEGIGDDATVYGWSFLVRETNNIEIRNLAVMEFYDDGISLDTKNINDWIHNCEIFYGANRGGDQVKGDGSLDVKNGSNWITFSYNHFWECGKTSLCGMTQDIGTEFFVTYHHNWFDHSDSRHPRVRAGTVHIYNNFYDGNAKYGAGATTASNLFVESNYFRNTKYPVLISMQGSDISGTGGKGTFASEDGGMIKMYGNIVKGGKGIVNAKDEPIEFDAYIADTRNEKVPDTYKTKQGGTTYNNFDTSADMYSYVADDAADVPTIVETYAGRIEGGDFKFDFDDAADDTSYDRSETLTKALSSYVSTLVRTYISDGNYPSTSGEVPPDSSTTPTVPLPTEVPFDYTVTKAEFKDNALNVELEYTGEEENPAAKLIVAAYDKNGAITDTVYMFDINGTEIENLNYTKPQNAETVKVYVWNTMDNLKPVSKRVTVK